MSLYHASCETNAIRTQKIKGLGVLIIHIQGKIHPRTNQKAQRNADVQLYYIFSLGARRGGWLRPCLCLFTPGNDPVPTAGEAETLAHIRSSNWIGRGGTRLRCFYALSCVVCDVGVLCAPEHMLNYYQGKHRLQIPAWGRVSLRDFINSSTTLCALRDMSRNFSATTSL